MTETVLTWATFSKLLGEIYDKGGQPLVYYPSPEYAELARLADHVGTREGLKIIWDLKRQVDERQRA